MGYEDEVPQGGRQGGLQECERVPQGASRVPTGCKREVRQGVRVGSHELWGWGPVACEGGVPWGDVSAARGPMGCEGRCPWSARLGPMVCEGGVPWDVGWGSTVCEDWVPWGVRVGSHGV